MQYGYAEVRPGYTVEPESCVHDLDTRNPKAQGQRCPDCGLSAVGRRKERELRDAGWTVSQISELGLMDD